MKKALFLALALLLVAGTAMAASVVGSHHDLSTGGGIADKSSNETQVCIFCHAPHNAYVNPAGSNTNTYPLWNHQLSVVGDYGHYDSDTMNANMSGASFGGATQSKSALCMSCHDGTVAVNSLYAYDPDSGVPVMGSGNELDGSGHLQGSANLGGTNALQNDHPVNFTYDGFLATADGGLYTPAGPSSVNANIPLYQSKVQCASCHKVHDPALTPFLRVTKDGSAICLNCHNK